ncbi:MAG: hypothetical protein O7A67_01465, partial [SAR324 cluster bacterium]|nr:hypothetical protein [SAR324 cluster bacterium]
MNRFILIALLAIAVIPLVAWGQEKPVAALGRVAVIGEISEGEKAIITNRLEKFLAARFQLVSEEEYLRAEDEAFLSLEEEECTEEACVRRIQEILQVDNLFILQIIREQDVTQLTLTLF